MTNTEIPAQIITDALDCSGATDVSIRTSYEGRGYARSGFGIVFDGGDMEMFFLELGIVAGRMEAEAVELGEESDFTEEQARDLIRAARTDNMGMGTIVYFPGFSIDGDLGYYGDED